MDSVPRHAKPVVWVVIAVMFASAIFAWEPWPFTSFRLFSQLRIDHQTAWLATTVEGDGTERDYPLGALPRGFRGFGFTMAEFAGASPERQDALCRTWVGAAPELVGRDAVEVRIYQRSWTLSERDESGAAPGSTTLEYVCTRGGASRAG